MMATVVIGLTRYSTGRRPRDAAAERKKSERALGRGDGARGAFVALGGHAQRTRKGLEHGLALLVGVVATQVVDVHRDARVIDEALEEFAREIDVEIADAGTGVIDEVMQPWAAGKIHHHA